MSKTLTFILFFSIGTVIISSIHYYLWLRFIRDTGLNGTIKNIGTYVLISLAISFPLTIALSRLLSFKYSFPLIWVSYLWLGVMMLLFFLLLFTDFVKVILYVFSKFLSSNENIASPERRKFISGIITTGASATVLIASGFGLKNYYSIAIVKKINMLLTGLPDVFKGFRIVQISDLHIGQLMTGKKLKEIVEQVNSLKPDLIAITGDIADGSVENLLNEVLPLRKLKSKRGVYFVTGNHEYYSGVDDWTIAIERMGIKVLNNESIKIEKGNDFFYLAGVTDHSAKRFGKDHAADFKKALSGLEKEKKKILLAHQPIAVREASQYGTDLVLSGHTHGGQIWPFNYFVYLQQPYLKGFYQYKNTKLYVNQGTGCWGPPLRLGSENEITEILLT